MKIKETKKTKIYKKDLEQAIGVKIDKWIDGKDYLKLICRNNNKKLFIYLQCEDLKQIIKLPFNLFNEEYTLKENVIEVEFTEETYRGSWKNGKLHIRK